MKRLACLLAVFFAVLFAGPRAAWAAADARLLDAIRRDDLAAVTRLVNAGADLAGRDEGGATPLMHAALYASPAVVQLLVDHGADVNAANRTGATALMWATSRAPIVKLLVERGASVGATASDGTTALVTAARRVNLDAMRILLESGANPKASADETVSLLRIGYSAEAPIDDSRVQAAMRDLLAGAGVALQDAGQVNSPIVQNFADVKVVEQLLDLGANPNQDFTIATLTVPALAIAAFEGRVDAMRALVARGADPNRAGTHGLTPLMMAAAGFRPKPEAVRLLIDKGARLDARDDKGRSALDWALTQGDTPVARLLREAGAPAKAPAPAPAPIAAPRPIRDAVARAVARLQPIGPTFNQRTRCISCHNESLPAVAVKAASAHGIAVDRDLARHSTEATLAMWEPRTESLRLGRRTIGGFLENVGYGLFAFAEEQVPPNSVTDAVTLCLASDQQPDGAWRVLDVRPPLGDADPIPYTALAIRALATYAPPGQRADAAARIARARAFLATAEAADTQDDVFKLLGLLWSDAPGADVARQAERLRAGQRDDGGWGQFRTTGSDAYATGQALYALQAAGMPVSDAGYRKGVDYLLRTQLEDGSWFVKSRAFAFQPYFDAGFPHGTDQFISAAATSWAVIALAPAIPR